LIGPQSLPLPCLKLCIPLIKSTVLRVISFVWLIPSPTFFFPRTVLFFSTYETSVLSRRGYGFFCDPNHRMIIRSLVTTSAPCGYEDIFPAQLGSFLDEFSPLPHEFLSFRAGLFISKRHRRCGDWEVYFACFSSTPVFVFIRPVVTSVSDGLILLWGSWGGVSTVPLSFFVSPT